MSNGRMLVRLGTILVCLSAAATTSLCQDDGKPAVAPTGAKTPKVDFHSEMLDLTLSYPASLSAQPLPSLKEQHDTIAARQGPQATPEERKSDSCSDKALWAVRADNPAKSAPTVTIYGDKRGTAVDLPPHPVNAKILISRVGIDCMPDAYKQQLDNLAASMSAALAQDRDLRPIDQPIWYPLANTRIHFAASESAQNANGAKGIVGGRWVGSAAFVWGGNLVSIVMESNDVAFFNEMLHSQLTLGKQPGAALFPADVGNGKPIQAKED